MERHVEQGLADLGQRWGVRLTTEAAQAFAEGSEDAFIAGLRYREEAMEAEVKTVAKWRDEAARKASP